MKLNELKREVEDKAVEYLNATRLDDLEERALTQLRKTANNGYIRLDKLEFSALLNAVRGLHRNRQLKQAEIDRLEEILKLRMAAIVWLIEDRDAPRGRWWRGSGYSYEANEAIRFSRKDDAEKVILTTLAHEPFKLIATDHIWYGGEWQKAEEALKTVEEK